MRRVFVMHGFGLSQKKARRRNRAFQLTRGDDASWHSPFWSLPSQLLTLPWKPWSPFRLVCTGVWSLFLQVADSVLPDTVALVQVSA
jgi:hypothetical protein